jgi:ABC-type dipeptide/oligopeptide/nickel transport system permease subunit
MSISPATGAAAADRPSYDRARIETPLARFWRRFRRQRVAMVALGFLIALSVIAVLAPWLTPYDPNAQSLSDRLQSPDRSHWLGTDDLGRDVFSRMLMAARVSLLAAVEATAVSLALGVPIGLVAGYVGGWFDTLFGRIADAIMAIPALLFALAIIGVLGPDITKAMLAIGFVNSPRFFRVVRGATLVVREQPFITAALALGGSPRRIITSHILPNVQSPLIVQISLSMGFAILFEAAISFLGLGVQPPDASWGTMLGRSTKFMEGDPYLVIFPGLAIFFTVLAFNVLGDAVNDALGRGTRSA